MLRLLSKKTMHYHSRCFFWDLFPIPKGVLPLLFDLMYFVKLFQRYCPPGHWKYLLMGLEVRFFPHKTCISFFFLEVQFWKIKRLEHVFHRGLVQIHFPLKKVGGFVGCTSRSSSRVYFLTIFHCCRHIQGQGADMETYWSIIVLGTIGHVMAGPFQPSLMITQETFLGWIWGLCFFSLIALLLPIFFWLLSNVCVTCRYIWRRTWVENCCGRCFWRVIFFLIFKIDHPNAESVEIQLLVFDFCWGCQTGFRHLPLAVLSFGDPRILRRVQASLEDWR